ncbi:MAG: transcriptional regulator, HxlR family [Thermoleophilia bacterium]|jgi:DNA-binding HxlR family transcriptional regulator|nr:transcriptional regulator, HxlR family [Thermoleophilia bacterium]
MVTLPAPAEMLLTDDLLAPAADVRRGYSELPLAKALTVVGDRWSLAVVAQLVEGPQRFNDLADALKPIARTVLSERLRRLEEASIITKRQYSDAPVRWNYRLSMSGAELARVAGVLADWGARHLGDGLPALVHTECGQGVMVAWHCSDCGPVPAKDLATSR